jgi:hypothetical protein
MPGILEFFSLQYGIKMKKKVTIRKMVAIFKREIFLNIGKNRNSLVIKGAEKKVVG